jgi:fibronectin type 3 domain-containing protein
VTATPGDSVVSLKWQPVTSFKDGSAIDMAMKYQVLRSVDGNAFEKLGEPVAATEYVDRQVSNGLKYFYTIQSMMVLKDDLVSGGASKQVTAIPVDLTPPAAPAGVTVVRTGVGTKIFWEKSDATDIGGYRIYRRAMDRDSFELLGKVEPEYTIFVDSKAEDSVRYFYVVTAIDRAIPPNESKKSREATTRY